MSQSTHSMTVLARIDAHSPGPKPSASRPPAISRTAPAVCFQVQLRQMPNSFCRIQTLSPRSSTAFQNTAGNGVAGHDDAGLRLQVRQVPEAGGSAQGSCGH
jgi:hypothetical protein